MFSHEMSSLVPFFAHDGGLPCSKLWLPRFYTSNNVLDLNRAWAMVGNGIHNNLGISLRNNLPKTQLLGEN